MDVCKERKKERERERERREGEKERRREGERWRKSERGRDIGYMRKEECMRESVLREIVEKSKRVVESGRESKISISKMCMCMCVLACVCV